jgi:hypothetical protein
LESARNFTPTSTGTPSLLFGMDGAAVGAQIEQGQTGAAAVVKVRSAETLSLLEPSALFTRKWYSVLGVSPLSAAEWLIARLESSVVCEP